METIACAKIKHETREGAERHVIQILAKDARKGIPPGGGRLHSYLCQCGYWHIGHRKKRRRGKPA